MSKPESSSPEIRASATLTREETLHVRDTCLCFRAQRAARALARRFDAAFRPLGLNNGQFSLMMMLNRSDPRSLVEVAAALAMDRTTLTAKLKPLVRRGLAEVAVDPADRRGRRISLTAAGRALLVAALPIWQREHEALEREMTAGTPAIDPHALRRGLESLT